MLEKDLEIKSTNKQWRKLVDYFNQWREEKFEEKGHFTYTMRFDHAHIISKKFGFIKWLVDNDKIDFSLIPNKIKEIGIPMKINGEIKYGFDSSDYYWLLMLLSIQKKPIQFLISILK